jgi:hypothetical protein
VKLFAMGFFEMGRVWELKFALVRAVVMCGLWWVSCSPIDDVWRMFPKFVTGSFVDSFSVSPSGELLGLGA